MPVARNVWQQVEAGSPPAAARRFMARTTRLVNVKPSWCGTVSRSMQQGG